MGLAHHLATNYVVDLVGFIDHSSLYLSPDSWLKWKLISSA
jgi:hypothetical protein